MTVGPQLVRIVLVGPDDTGTARDAVNLIGGVAWLAAGEMPEALAGDTDRTVTIEAVNAYGDHRVLFHTNGSDGVAKRDRVEAELVDLPFEDWCTRYGLTPTWCRGEPSEVRFDADERGARRTTALIALAMTAMLGYVWWVGVVPLGWGPAVAFALIWVVAIAVSYWAILHATVSGLHRRRH